MKAIARISIVVPDEFLKSLSQDDIRALMLNKSRLTTEQQHRLMGMIYWSDDKDMELLVDLNALVAANCQRSSE